jgi:hypothetical protein
MGWNAFPNSVWKTWCQNWLHASYDDRPPHQAHKCWHASRTIYLKAVMRSHGWIIPITAPLILRPVRRECAQAKALQPDPYLRHTTFGEEKLIL